MSIRIYGATSGYVDLDAPAVAGSASVTLPGSGTLAVTASPTISTPTFTGQSAFADGSASAPSIAHSGDSDCGVFFPAADTICATTAGSERIRIDNSGNFMVNTTNTLPADNNVAGTSVYYDGLLSVSRASNVAMNVNLKGLDGTLINLRQDGTAEGSISVSGNTVSYNAFMGSHYTELDGDAPLRGTVMETLDALVEDKYHLQDRLPKCKVSDTQASKSVYGVYFCPDEDDSTPNGHLIAAVGASWIRIAAGQMINRGDFVESNGDGCARVQGDDVVRSSTVAKVTSVTVVETYDDGSYLVPCVLMCG